MVMISFIFFSGKLAVEQGVSYEYYFEVFDNDARNGFKSSKTPVFSNRIVTDEEKRMNCYSSKMTISIVSRIH
jgi:hypothetical protein